MRLRQIEAALEKTLEGAFGPLTGGTLHALEIYHALWREMEDGRVVSAHTTYTPNRLVARLNPHDIAPLEGIKGRLETELGSSLQGEARHGGWSFGARILVRIEADEAVRAGRVAVSSKIDEDPLPAQLAVGSGDTAGQVFSVQPGLIIGRAADCGIVLPDEAVSRHHCRFEWVFEGYRITDLGSSNGTSVNDVQVMDYVLNDNDVVTVGTTRLRFGYETGDAMNGSSSGT